MASTFSAKVIGVLIITTCLSGLVLANDAGSGGDAGDGVSSATWLPASNATYYGNFSNNDSNDYYGVNLSSGYGLSATLTSPPGADYDLILYDHANSSLDGSYNGGASNASTYDSVTTNGTNTSGTGNTVYLRVQKWSGYGTYTLQVWVFVASSTGGNNSGGNNSGGGSGGGTGGNQSDANTGGDASNSQSNPTTLNASDATYHGYVHETDDEYDWYSFIIPAYYSISAEVSWNNTSANIRSELFDQNGNTIATGSSGNPVFTNSSNRTIGGTTVTLSIRANTGETIYTMILRFRNISSAPVYNQNDAGTGGDASNNFSSPTFIATSISGINGTGGTHFTGWHSQEADQDDYYSVYVPPDYGIAIDLTSNPSEVLSWILLMNSSSGQYYGWSTNQHGSQNTHSNGSDVGGQHVTLWIVTFNGEGYYNFTVWLFSTDTDGDGWSNEMENSCGTDPYDNTSIPQDTDGDGICNPLDNDDDGDGYDDSEDAFPLNNTEWKDTDYDGIGDNADEDDDNDGWSDADENDCGSNSTDSRSTPTDTDDDGECDLFDTDDDGDGYDDAYDSFPLNGTEWSDLDGDGVGDNADTDDDGDGFSDSMEEACDSDPLTNSSIPLDTDLDGSCDSLDEDDDNDGVTDTSDAFPLNPNEWVDTDDDSIGDNSDEDDDNDGYPDSSDAFPLDYSEWSDLDLDGTGDNADEDDDNDGWSDSEEQSCDSDQASAESRPADYDSDQICDEVDTDDDADGVDDTYDMFPFDANEWEDTDLDGVGNNADLDDDGDGWDDIEETNCGTTSDDANSFPSDFDVDGICDALDPDDDNDMILDSNDVFPFDPSESRDTDGDGVGDNSDDDDDDDLWSDTLEEICQSDPLSVFSKPLDTDEDGLCDIVDTDDDGDGVGDNMDDFPLDSSRWEKSGDSVSPLILVLATALTIGVFGLYLSRRD